MTRSLGTKVSRAVTVAMLALTLAAGGGIANVAEAQAATPAQVRAAKAAKVRRAKAKRAAARKRLQAKRAKALRAKKAARKRAAVRKKQRAAAAKAAAKRKRARARKAAAARKARARARARRAFGRGWHSAEVSWYGPGFYGHGMAGGGKLTKESMIVAHKTLPFGTKVEFSYKGKTVVATVKDRGPYVRGRAFDLGPGIARALNMYSVANMRYRIVG